MPMSTARHKILKGLSLLLALALAMMVGFAVSGLVFGALVRRGLSAEAVIGGYVAHGANVASIIVGEYL